MLLRQPDAGDVEQRLRGILLLRSDDSHLAIIFVCARNHDVEAPVATFLFGFDQAHFLQGLHVLFHPFDLGLAHAAALQVNGKARQM